MYNTYIIVCLSFLLMYASVNGAKQVDKLSEDVQYLVITEDVIPDVENTTHKIIRVNPLDLPSIGDDKEMKEDSALYKVMSLQPAFKRRKYVNSKGMRRQRPQMKTSENPDVHTAKPRSSPADSKFTKQVNDKQLKFMYDQPTMDGQKITKSMRVKVAPGAYPIYYTVAKVNGKFGKFPIKSFRTPTQFMKYLLRSKSESIDLSQRYES